MVKTEQEVRLLKLGLEREVRQMQHYHNLVEIERLEMQITLIKWVLDEEMVDD